MDGQTDTDTAAAARGAGRKRLPPNERREQIVNEAVRFFAEVGLEGNTRLLAKRLGVTQSLLFNYFSTKEELIEAVYERVYLDSLSPDWPDLLTDRSIPLRKRLLAFYSEYSAMIFQREWMRIFMFSGLAGAALNHRYLEHLGNVILRPVLTETQALAKGERRPIMEDIWNLHGGIVYIGIRQHIYQMPGPNDANVTISRAIDKYLNYFDIGAED